jgi:hypothetical protein
MKTFLVAIFLSCIAMAQNDDAIAKAKAACGPDDVHFDFEITDAVPSVLEPKAGKARIYVVGQDFCCGIIARVGMNGAWLGAIRGNSYLTASIDPGERHLCTQWQSRFSSRSKYVALANLTAEAGKTYYFRMRLMMQANGRPFLDLDALNSDQGKYLVLTSQTSNSKVEKH